MPSYRTIYSMTSQQPLIMFLSILPALEYEVKRGPSCNGQQLEREYVFQTICSR